LTNEFHRTGIDDALTLCSRHHTRVHHPTYQASRTSTGRLKLTRIRQ
jgi:hypothetical protein